MRSRIVLFTILMALFVSSLAFAQAEQDSVRARDDENVRHQRMNSAILDFNGKYYQVTDILREFLDVAFSSAIWGQDQGENYPLYFTAPLFSLREDILLPTLKRRKEEFLWASPYLLREAWPKVGLINKWKGEITIGIDWPQYRGKIIENPDTFLNARPLTDPRDWKYEDVKKSYKRLQAHAEPLASKLSEITGLPVKFISPDDPVERTENFAKIRLVPYKTPQQQKIFREVEVVSGPGTITSNMIESYLEGAVPFTADSKTGVTGYFLSSPTNEITMAVCKINPDAGDDHMASAVSECLLRSLGLPERSGESGTLLSSDDISQGAIKSISPYDEMMAKVLYCNEVKPGMDKNEAMVIVYKSKCIDNLKRNKNGH